MATLYRLSILKTASLLKNCFWCDVYVNNPFSLMPSHIVDDLLTAVIEITPSTGLRLPEIYHLLTSGQLKNLKFEDMYLKKDEFLSMLMSITAACQKLQCVIFRNVSFSDSFEGQDRSPIKEGINCLLSISPQLEMVESCLEFDLMSLRNCQQLKVLKLNFKCGPLHYLLNQDENGFIDNKSLTILEVYLNIKNYQPYEVHIKEIVPILKHCTALKETNFDITGALAILHANDLNRGVLNVQYNLRKTVLGNAVYGCANVQDVQIATFTCPHLEALDVLIDAQEVIFALGDFQNLTSLLLQWDLPVGGDFQPAMKTMLQKVGPRLKSLHIFNFYNVDFADIASNCPLLVELRIELRNEICHSPPPPNGCFTFLKSLQVEFIEEGFTLSASTLILLLKNCQNVEKFSLNNSSNLTDEVLDEILKAKSLVQLKDASILECNLTGDGLRHMILSLVRLEFIQFSSTAIEFEEASQIVHEINPRVLVEEVPSDYFM